MNSRVVPFGALAPEEVEQVLAAAQRAPAVNHRRPWRLQCVGATIEMFLDLSAESADADDDREAWVACGAALLNVRLAIRSFGVDDAVRVLPDLERPDLLAIVQIQGRRPASAGVLELTAVMPLLDLQPADSLAGPVSEALRTELRHAARIEQAWLATMSPGQLPDLRPLVAASDQYQLAGASPMIAAIGTIQDDLASRLRAGQAIQRVLLTATKWGLNTWLLQSAPDRPDTREHLRRLIGGGLWPFALVRIGTG